MAIIYLRKQMTANQEKTKLNQDVAVIEAIEAAWEEWSADIDLISFVEARCRPELMGLLQMMRKNSLKVEFVRR